MRQPTFPIFGTAYYPEAVDEGEWARDLAAMRAHGLTCVRWGEFSWSLWEPSEGRFDFALSDRFVAAVRAAGLELILCTPTATPPPWIIHGHPDWLMRDQADRPHLGVRHYGCHHHPGYLAAVERVVAEVAGRYRDQPHLVGWQIDNEPILGECFAGNTYDYHPLAVAAFRTWCERRYGSVGALNDAWQGHFWSRGLSSFAQLDAPRPGISVINQSAWVAWCRFRAEALAAFVAWQRDLLRRLSPGVSVGTNIPDVSPTMMARLGQDYWAQARGLDWAGTDLYAFRKDPLHERRLLAYETDLMRSALTADGARFFIMETQGGPHNLPWRMDFVGGHFGPEYLDRCAQIFARGGAQGVCFFLWRPWRTGAECGMNGLCDADGTPGERVAALPGIYARVRTILAEADPRPRVLMHYSQASIALAAQLDPERTPDTAIPGWHALCAEVGLRVEFVDERTLAARTWTAADRLILPYAPILGEAECASLRRLADAGGRLIAGYATGFFDEEARIRDRRPAGLIDLLGLRQRAFDHLAGAQAWTAGALSVVGNVALIDRDGCTVEAADDAGRPLLTSHRQRRCWYAACDLGSLVWARAGGLEPLLRLLRDGALKG